MAALEKNVTAPSEILYDFGTLDFEHLWRGRDRTTEVELALARAALVQFPPERILELGTGEGRLSPAVWNRAHEYVGVDQRFEFLARLRRRLPDPSSSLLIEANVYHLPLVGRVGTAALLARVYNFLPDPGAALREIRRVLAPGGGLVLSCAVRPSIASLWEDLRLAVTRPGDPGRSSFTFSRDAVVSGLPRRGHLRETLAAAGFAEAGIFGCGLEDFRIARRIPARTYVAAGAALGRAPVFPLAWRLGRLAGAGGDGPLPALRGILACPRCANPFGELDVERDQEILCPSCGFVVRIEGGIVRARYVAPRGTAERS